MAKKSEEEEVREWTSRINISEGSRESVAKEFRWHDFEEEFKGIFNLSNIAQDAKLSIPPINLVYAMTMTEIANLSLKDPHFEVTAKNKSTILSARIRELAINYIWRHKRMKGQSKRSLLDALLVGHGWFKTGYTGTFGTIEDGSGHVSEFIESEDFFGYHVRWEDISFNIDCLDPPHDCRWMAHQIVRPIDEVKKNKRFSGREDLKATFFHHNIGNKEGAPLTSKGIMDDPMLQKVRMWEVWDITKKEVFTLAEGLDKYLEKPKKWPYEMRGFPFSFLAFNRLNDTPYPVPDTWQYEPQVLELIKIRAMQLDHLKRFNRQIEVLRGALSEEQKSNLALGLTGNIVESEQFGKIQPIAYPPIQADIYAVEDRVKEDLANIAPQSALDRGAMQRTSTRTVGELKQIQKGNENRRAERLDNYEDFLEDIGRNLISILMQFADEPFYVKLTGEEPQALLEQLQSRPSALSQGAVTDKQGFTFTREDIQGEFDLDVKVGSTIPLNRENKILIIQDIIEKLPKLGVDAKSPVMGAIGKMLADELDLPELKVAIEQHGQMLIQQRQQQEEQLEEQRQLEATKFGVENQLEAEKIQSKERSDILDLITAQVNSAGGKNKKE